MLKKLACVCSTLALLGVQIGPLHAALVPTDKVFEQSAVAGASGAELAALVDQSQVRERLQALGVDPAEAKARIERMTDEELAVLQANLDELPAGSGVVGTIAIVFLVLLATDIAGLTDIFPFVKK